MIHWKPILKFLLLFLLYYGCLLIAGAFNEDGYEKRFRAFGEYFFEDFRGKGIVAFEKVKEVEEKHFNTVMKIASKQRYDAFKKNGSPYKLSSVTASGWYMGYLPIILLVSLIMATPVTWKRKGIALLWGLLVIHIFIWLKLYIQLLYEFNRAGLDAASFSGFRQNLMDILHVLFVVYMGPTFIIPVFIWILVTFRKGDLEKLRT